MTVSVNQNKLTYDLSDLTFTPTKSLYLFSVNDSNSTTLTSGGSMCGRIDTFLISEGDQIVRQFVPCLDADGIPCMYELYTGTAYYNQGSGNFSYPRVYSNDPINLPAGYTKCVYLQSSGTQYIDTLEHNMEFHHILILPLKHHIGRSVAEDKRLFIMPREMT